MLQRRTLSAIIPAALALLAASALYAQATNWPNYGNDPGGSRYSPLRAITPQNVDKLTVAWTYHHGDIADGSQSKFSSKSAFEATPLMIDGTLYFPTPFNRVIALDAATGKEKWVYDPKLNHAYDSGDGFVCRGLGSWKDPATGHLNLYVATVDSRLIGIDAATGKSIFIVSLNEDVGARSDYPGEYHFTSPPAVVGDKVVVGSAIDDNNRTKMPSGVVRAFDARTGKLAWKWDPIPLEKNAGAANAWSVMSVDPDRDLVFIPTGSASPDHYGGERLGDNKWANSVVALKGSTGELVWGFQTVHHDLWDYDVPAQPVLASVKGQPALIQSTKTGQIFVFNRETGVPVFPVEERPVPQTTVPGEKTSPTQPFSSLPPLVPHGPLKPADAWGMLYFDRKGCETEFGKYRSEGIFTPPSLDGTLMYPSIIGGSNWGSVAFDPERQLVIANTSRLPFAIGLVPRDQQAAARKLHPKAEWSPMRGTPYVMWREPMMSSLGVPCVTPPWGTLTALDLRTGKIAWQVPFGTTRDLAPVPVAMKWGTPTLGGPIATASGLVFIGAALDNYLRAYDITTGQELWKDRLPAGAQATPMTYAINGRQYVVICAGGHGKLGSKLGDSVIAYALPK